MHFALHGAILALLEIPIDLALNGGRVRSQSPKEATHLQAQTEENIERAGNGMLKLLLVRSERLDCNVVDGFAHRYLFGSESVLDRIVDMKVEPIVVQILAEANVVDRVRKDALKLDRDVNFCCSTVFSRSPHMSYHNLLRS